MKYRLGFMKRIQRPMAQDRLSVREGNLAEGYFVLRRGRKCAWITAGPGRSEGGEAERLTEP